MQFVSECQHVQQKIAVHPPFISTELRITNPPTIIRRRIISRCRFCIRQDRAHDKMSGKRESTRDWETANHRLGAVPDCGSVNIHKSVINKP